MSIYSLSTRTLEGQATALSDFSGQVTLIVNVASECGYTKQYGGLEFSAYANACVIMKLSSRSATASSTIGVPNSLGPAELLLHYGTEDQKNRYLPGLAAGTEIPCFALTSPQAGSDAPGGP